MKYKEVYLALNQRKLDAPGFHYSDYSGWKAANQSYMTRQRPLWIVAEDRLLADGCGSATTALR